jgi:outer membrane protein TolC
MYPVRLSVVMLCFATWVLSGCSLAPEALDQSALKLRAQSALAGIDADQEAIAGPITLYEAMARAFKYDLDHRLEIAQTALKMEQLNVAHFNLLPNLVANSGYVARNELPATTSLNLQNNQLSSYASTSQGPSNRTDDLTFSWNILDFGLSYVRARQAGDRALIAEELRRKVANRLLEDVRTAYWRAHAAERLSLQLAAVEQRMRDAQAKTRSVADERQTSPVAALTIERDLIDVRRKIEEIERDLLAARTQLAALMNVKPDTKFQLAALHAAPRSSDPWATAPIDAMVDMALEQRSELREAWYNKRINRHEADAALLELLPGLQLFAGRSHDSNVFLENNNWLSWGTKVSWNLIGILQYPAKQQLIAAQDKVLDVRGLAVGMAVITQVHVSRIRYRHALKEYRTSVEYLDVQRRLRDHLRQEMAAARLSMQALVREEVNTLIAEAKRDLAYAGVQNAMANVRASIGQEFVPKNVNSTRICELAAQIESSWLQRPPRPSPCNKWIIAVAN